MNKPNKPLIYCDACVYIKIFGREDYWEICKRVVMDAEFDRIRLVFSYAGVAEVQCPPEYLKFNNANQLIQDYFDNQPSIIKVNVDRFIALKAREIQANAPRDVNGKIVNSFDAIHLATAVSERVDAFFTYDKKVLGLNGLPCVEKLKICKPERFWDTNLELDIG